MPPGFQIMIRIIAVPKSNVFKNIIESLKDDGIFVGQFFGNGDEWANAENMTFLTLEKTKEILSNLGILSFKEEEKEKADRLR
jgi:hypothetical protein